ncbi:MAG: hypothetical protein H7288_07470 [Kineosporiaceae bacterium]|nr:hypothetical protein [Aeromicrobium sp.]
MNEPEFMWRLIAFRVQVIAAVERAGGHGVRLHNWLTDATEENEFDIALLVDFRGRTIGFAGLIKLAAEIGEIVGGASVNIETTGSEAGERLWREATPL